MNDPSVAPLRVFATRLEPGVDLRKALVELAIENRIGAGILLGAVGSLKAPEIRFASQKQPTKLAGCWEILSLSGTVSSQGIHVHLMISDSQGKCLGGHLVAGCEVYTTVEIAIAELNGFFFAREADERTGYPELKVERKS